MKLYLTALVTLGSVCAMSQTTLGSYTFNDAAFGDTLVESDGGTYSGGNWLNTTNADPGNPGYLTGVGFETGIANIGLSNPVTYTIGYTGGILNVAGADLGIVVARYSEDPLDFAVSEDGVNFTSFTTIAANTANSTGEMFDYFYQGGGPFQAELFVHEVDLSDYGVALGNSVLATSVIGTTQLDLIRVAGLHPVPEPSTFAGLGLGALVLLRRRRA